MSAYELRFPSTANSLSGRKAEGRKKPRAKDDDHLRWVRTLPSLVIGSERVEAAHIRYADARFRKPSVGMGEKPDDKWVVPLAADEHRKQHSMNEQAYWRECGIDPVLVALLLFNNTGNDEEGENIIRQFQKLGLPKHQEQPHE
jgi:hypothetical protein